MADISDFYNTSQNYLYYVMLAYGTGWTLFLSLGLYIYRAYKAARRSAQTVSESSPQTDKDV